MGVEPFLISSSLLAIMAQRLVRTLCPECKEPYQLTPEEITELGLQKELVANTTVYRPKDGGCRECQFSGYHGRMGIHELLIIDEAVRSKIMQRENASQIRAASTSITSLRADGAHKVLLGHTSFEEVLRVTQEDAIE